IQLALNPPPLCPVPAPPADLIRMAAFEQVRKLGEVHDHLSAKELKPGFVWDKDEKFDQPVVPNGIPLSKIHHAAFDAHLIGIDPDYRLHVADRLLVQNDGPMLETLKQRLRSGQRGTQGRDIKEEDSAAG
ncbi:MAG: hypothetical protein Q7T63_22330, partial [Burkholderiaceae bacterium]|nr:hypothetical protein [Burkholderiaceae bacterium]